MINFTGDIRYDDNIRNRNQEEEGAVMQGLHHVGHVDQGGHGGHRVRDDKTNDAWIGPAPHFIMKLPLRLH